MTPTRAFALILALSLLAASPAAGQEASPASKPTSRPSSKPASRPAEAPDAAFAREVEAHHERAAWEAQGALEARIVLHFGGKKRFEATMWMETTSARARLAIDGGPTIVFDGERAWVTPADAEFPRARFHILTWPYFVAAPFKLRDPGSRLEAQEPMTLEGASYEVAKLTFEAGVGDTPDDWYYAFRDPKTHELRALSYIVTYGQSAEEASKEPHICVYDEAVTVGGVKLSKRWRFFNWSLEKGLFGEAIGEATLSELRFAEAPAGAFDKPEGAREATLP